MFKISNFIGAIQHSLSLSRAMSDNTSVKIAQKYLDHPLLKGFPVPRMKLKDVDIELNFAVGPANALEQLLKEPEVAKNIVFKFRDLLAGLPQSDAFRQNFGTIAPSDKAWQQGSDELIATVTRILGDKPQDEDVLVHTLALAVENFFYAMHYAKPGQDLLPKLLPMLSNFMSRQASPATPATPAAPSSALHDWTVERVTDILSAAIPGGLGNVGELPELNILVGATDLAAHGPDKLHKAKLSFTSDDRKWVATESNGEKKYILDR